MHELNKIPFPEVKRLADGGRALTILPVGVVEEHGAHLPLGVDSFAAEIYSASAAPHLEEAGYEVVIAPTINYGVARAAIDFPGTLSLEPETLRSMVVEIGRSLARHGLNRLVILNGHRDLHHMKALDDARAILVEEKSRASSYASASLSDPEVTAACYRDGVRQFYQSPRPDREGHGGESETSVALHSFPEFGQARDDRRADAELRLRCRGVSQRNQRLLEHQRWPRLLRLAAGGDGGDGKATRRRAWQKYRQCDFARMGRAGDVIVLVVRVRRQAACDVYSTCEIAVTPPTQTSYAAIAMSGTAGVRIGATDYP